MISIEEAPPDVSGSAPGGDLITRQITPPLFPPQPPFSGFSRFSPRSSTPYVSRWNGDIWTPLNIEVLRANEGEVRWEWSSTGMQGRGEKGDPRENPVDQRHRPPRFPHANIRERTHRGSNPVLLGEVSSSSHHLITPILKFSYDLNHLFHGRVDPMLLLDEQISMSVYKFVRIFRKLNVSILGVFCLLHITFRRKLVGEICGAVEGIIIVFNTTTVVICSLYREQPLCICLVVYWCTTRTRVHRREPGSINGGVAPGFSHVGILPNDATDRRVFSGISRFCQPCIPALVHTPPHFTLIGSRDLDVKSLPNLYIPFYRAVACEIAKSHGSNHTLIPFRALKSHRRRSEWFQHTETVSRSAKHLSTNYSHVTENSSIRPHVIAGMQEGGEVISEKIHRPVVSFDTIPTCEIQGRPRDETLPSLVANYNAEIEMLELEFRFSYATNVANAVMDGGFSLGTSVPAVLRVSTDGRRAPTLTCRSREPSNTFGGESGRQGLRQTVASKQHGDTLNNAPI
ncbi:hypothetical protein PR048_002584 [Dryococelus australis]|uniref:Uncharacterized protein n=1 Tax=Dryococelus australis TaxID=614101 RepID=A0ABQ9IKK6_9NEOP|nr:hypothetical protein PR048_002584 [Dryococelus australis]